MINIIERAFQLASESATVDEVKQKLVREGYMQVHSHLAGHRIRRDILERLNPELVTFRRAEKTRRA
jgi:DNA-directed RNA polymerase subunit K/omega